MIAELPELGDGNCTHVPSQSRNALIIAKCKSVGNDFKTCNSKLMSGDCVQKCGIGNEEIVLNKGVKNVEFV